MISNSSRFVGVVSSCVFARTASLKQSVVTSFPIWHHVTGYSHYNRLLSPKHHWKSGTRLSTLENCSAFSVMVHCCVPLCFNSRRRNPNLSFYSFPKENKLALRWHRLIRRDRGSKFKVRNSNRVLLRSAILQDAGPQCFGVVHLTKLLPSFKI